jgi:ribosome-associated protein
VETLVMISTPDITLGDALKLAGVAPTGGQAKWLVRGGRVAVNGQVERRRGRRLRPGDRIAIDGLGYRIVAH